MPFSDRDGIKFKYTFTPKKKKVKIHIFSFWPLSSVELCGLKSTEGLTVAP